MDNCNGDGVTTISGYTRSLLAITERWHADCSANALAVGSAATTVHVEVVNFSIEECQFFKVSFSRTFVPIVAIALVTKWTPGIEIPLTRRNRTACENYRAIVY